MKAEVNKSIYERFLIVLYPGSIIRVYQLRHGAIANPKEQVNISNRGQVKNKISRWVL